MRVLIVEDTDDARYLLRLLLSADGYLVEEAENGAVALEKARATPPDMIVSDVLMPVMDGF